MTRNAPIRILHLLSIAGRGGAEVRTLELLRRIDPRQHQFEFCFLSGQRGELEDEILQSGGQVHHLQAGTTAFARRFRQLLAQRRIDVVYAHVLHASGYLLRLANQSGVPLRVAYFRSSHDGRKNTWRRRFYRVWMHRWMDAHATHLLAVSAGALDAVWGGPWRGDARCQVIHDGLDPDALRVAPDRGGVRREFGLAPDAPLYLHVGRLSAAKNHGRLLAIFQRLRREQPAARLLLVGGGERRAEVEAEIGRLQLGVAVRACGPRTDVARLLAAADLMFFPSLWEGLGNAVMEASAVGTPVLASDLPSIREIARRLPGITRLPLAESDECWVRQALRLAAVPPDAAARHAAWRTFAQSIFTLDECLRRHRAIWDQTRQRAAA